MFRHPARFGILEEIAQIIRVKLAIVSHKVCWKSDETPGSVFTDGGFPVQVKAISELFDETRVVVPCGPLIDRNGLAPLAGNNLGVSPLSIPKNQGFRRKLIFPIWLLTNGPRIWREICRADAVHAGIPGDVGTIGMLFALIQRKPLFVRHCGNWLAPRTLAEHFWKWAMERFAGSRNVMLATGGSSDPPSPTNPHVRWIFSTSLRRDQLAMSKPLTLPDRKRLKLIVACRQEEGKGTDIVIKSLPAILKTFPGATLEVIGSGSFMPQLRLLIEQLNLRDKVFVRGRLEQLEVVERMKRSHVFCFPTQASEGFPKVVLEALACGLPVVTTRVSVLPRLIGTSCGVVLDEPTPVQLAAGVEMICRDPDTYAAMSASAVATAKQYSLEHWRDSIGDILRRSWKVASLSSSVTSTKALQLAK